MNKIISYFKDRFSKFNIHNVIIAVASFLVAFIGLYFSIGMSVSVSKGYTLFGNSNNRTYQIESEGPTSSDVKVITLFWVLTSLVLIFAIFYLFFYKLPEKVVIKKDIIEGKVVELDNQDNEDK